MRDWNRKEAIQRAAPMIVKIEDENLDPQKAKRDAIERQGRHSRSSLRIYRTKSEERLRPWTLTDYKRYLERYYFEPFHKRPFDEIGRDEFKKQIKIIEEVAKAPMPEAAMQHKSLSRGGEALYDWAAGVDLFLKTAQIPYKVEAPVKNRSRDRVLTHDEIRIIWKACDDWEAQTLDFAARA